jgi:hypothetical protein
MVIFGTFHQMDNLLELLLGFQGLAIETLG